MFQLPREIQQLIYEYDPTYHDVYWKVRLTLYMKFLFGNRKPLQ